MLQIDGRSFSLRPATEEDLPQVLEIENSSFPKPWSRHAFEEEIKKPFSSFLVLTDDETDSFAIAYIVYWVVFDECHILNVAVHREWKGLGIGSRLIRQAINQGLQKDLKRVFLEVRKSNTAAIEMYQKLGFFIDHLKKHFYEDGEDAYFMVLYLNKKNDF